MIASRRRPGTISRDSSTRLPASSSCCTEMPVTLPPGRLKLAIRPVPIGSDIRVTIGIAEVTCFAWTSEIGNEALPDRIGNIHEDDWNRRSLLRDGSECRRRGGHDHVWF